MSVHELYRDYGELNNIDFSTVDVSNTNMHRSIGNEELESESDAEDINSNVSSSNLANDSAVSVNDLSFDTFRCRLLQYSPYIILLFQDDVW